VAADSDVIDHRQFVAGILPCRISLRSFLIASEPDITVGTIAEELVFRGAAATQSHHFPVRLDLISILVGIPHRSLYQERALLGDIDGRFLVALTSL